MLAPGGLIKKVPLLLGMVAMLPCAVTASAQVISNVAATGISNTSAIINWTTNLPASSLVNYGVTSGYGASSPLNALLTTAHTVTLTGLTPNTLYHFDVVSSSGGNPATASANFRFATLSTAPVIGNINVIYLTSTSATINWTTDQPASGLVNYGTTTNYGASSALSSAPVIAHSITLNGLTPSTTYNFDVVSAGQANVPSSSANQTITTPAAAATAPSVGFVAAYGFTDSSAVLSWSTDVPANTSLAYGTTLALGQLTPMQPAMTASHGVVLTNLNRGTTYYFVAVSTGANGVTGYSILFNLTTTALPSLVPVITKVAATSLTTTSATISWTTDVPSTSQVNYGTTSSYGSSSVLDSTVTTSHAVTLTGLAPGTRYVYQLVSASANGTSIYGADMPGMTIWAWGDSLTQGYGDLTPNTYPLYLTTALGVPVLNKGIGGETSTQIAARMLSTPASFTAGNCGIFWAGGNNRSQVSTVLADNASMIAALNTPKCFLVLGDINSGYAPSGTSDYNAIIDTNVALAAQYPNNYLNIRKLLVDAYNPALPLDVATHATDNPASSLLAVQAHGTITSGALDGASCVIGVSNGTLGAGTAIVIDSETILINAVTNTVTITACTRGYNGTAAASHAANANYSIIDSVHLGSNGYEFVAQHVAEWFAAQFPLNFTTPVLNTPGPVVTAVTASNINSTAAVISWTTDQPSTSLVNYGLSSSYGATSQPDTTLTLSHSAVLTGLTEGSVYNYSVVSVNAAGRSTSSGNFVFNTGAAGPPEITNVVATNLTATSATIAWTTSQPATAQVKLWGVVVIDDDVVDEPGSSAERPDAGHDL